MRKKQNATKVLRKLEEPRRIRSGVDRIYIPPGLFQSRRGSYNSVEKICEAQIRVQECIKDQCQSTANRKLESGRKSRMDSSPKPAPLEYNTTFINVPSIG
ncbi:unnamed protein product [Lepeophtheirus salmonis]|uniref:(salmon louse) hypothetical protein n=1 Tax=Lepeophtheirus salmonis TaxID=72036 RepID=A0A7R8H895_LEPSM|nr:unnamed protein product [Lepeophtheirus salmonis]CAF2937943.1 unnamed protein product [Lepeophtheirus salmonis]